jgi:hypothetical protein
MVQFSPGPYLTKLSSFKIQENKLERLSLAVKTTLVLFKCLSSIWAGFVLANKNGRRLAENALAYDEYLCTKQCLEGEPFYGLK